MCTNPPTTPTATLIETTTLMRASDLQQVAPHRCRACGSSLGHVSPVLVIDRLMDAAAYLEAMELAPLAVTVDTSGLVQVLLELADFQRVTTTAFSGRGMAVSTTDQPGVGRVYEAKDSHFRLRAVERSPE